MPDQGRYDTSIVTSLCRTHEQLNVFNTNLLKKSLNINSEMQTDKNCPLNNNTLNQPYQDDIEGSDLGGTNPDCNIHKGTKPVYPISNDTDPCLGHNGDQQCFDVRRTLLASNSPLQTSVFKRQTDKTLIGINTTSVQQNPNNIEGSDLGGTNPDCNIHKGTKPVYPISNDTDPCLGHNGDQQCFGVPKSNTLLSTNSPLQAPVFERQTDKTLIGINTTSVQQNPNNTELDDGLDHGGTNPVNNAIDGTDTYFPFMNDTDPFFGYVPRSTNSHWDSLLQTSDSEMQTDKILTGFNTASVQQNQDQTELDCAFDHGGINPVKNAFGKTDPFDTPIDTELCQGFDGIEYMFWDTFDDAKKSTSDSEMQTDQKFAEIDVPLIQQNKTELDCAFDHGGINQMQTDQKFAEIDVPLIQQNKTELDGAFDHGGINLVNNAFGKTDPFDTPIDTELCRGCDGMEYNMCHHTFNDAKTSTSDSQVQRDQKLAENNVPSIKKKKRKQIKNSLHNAEPPDGHVTYKIVEGGSQQNNPKLYSSDGYQYTEKLSKDTFTIWRCIKKSNTGKIKVCRATVYQKGKSYETNQHEHNHPPDKEALTKAIIEKEVKEIAKLDPGRPARQIVEDYVKEHGLKLSMPEILNLRRSVQSFVKRTILK